MDEAKSLTVNDRNAGVFAEQLLKRLVSSIELNVAVIPPNALIIDVCCAVEGGIFAQGQE